MFHFETIVFPYISVLSTGNPLEGFFRYFAEPFTVLEYSKIAFFFRLLGFWGPWC